MKGAVAASLNAEPMRNLWNYRFVPFLFGLAVALTFVSAAISAGSPNLDEWFLDATSFNAPGVARPIGKPDFLVSSDWKSCAGGHFEVTAPQFYGVWSLLKYDPKHHLAFARGVTDQCSLALFKAAPPAVKVPNVDLSGYGTVRGIRIGTPYAKVLALYGPPVKRGRRFVTSYSASFPAVAMNHKQVRLDQRITLVVTDGLVSSISIYIDEAALF